jgi:hypothetical protein
MLRDYADLQSFSNCSFAPLGLNGVHFTAHGLRRGLHSFAASRLCFPILGSRLQLEIVAHLLAQGRAFLADHDGVLHLPKEVADGRGRVRHEYGVALIVRADFFHSVKVLSHEN